MSAPTGVAATTAASSGIVSGRFEGPMTAPKTGGEILELRVDVDARPPGGIATGRISGDFFAVNTLNLPGAPPREWKVYRESWIVDAPVVTHTAAGVNIVGTARFWEGTHPPATIAVHVPVAEATIGPARVLFTFQGGTIWQYNCLRTGEAFRQLELQVDVCASVNRPPLLPDYDISTHPDVPAGLPPRRLTIESAYAEAGVSVEIREQHTVIDDSHPDFSSWSDAELHDAMESHFADITLEWPRWAMWGVLAGSYEDTAVGGIMFDAAADFGGAGRAPERQGFAVFRNHPWFARVPVGGPSDKAEAAALRQYLYTWVHEAGHAFNFLHSWNKNRPDSLSWMNYDWRYDNRNGKNAFWKGFQFRFDDEELIHLRHGNRASVIMGGDPWASGGHLEAPPGAEHLQAAPAATAHAIGEVPIELLLRSKGYFDFMEPVTVEVRLRNLLAHVPLQVDTQLQPEFGGLVIFIRRPSGRILEYSPILCKLADSKMRTVSAAGESETGDDRYSEQVDLTYGRYGFYFEEPGNYLVRALYQGSGDVLIPSNTLRLRVGHPATREIDRQAQDFFVYEVGMNLYLNGSQSPFLQKGFDFLQSIIDRHANTEMGAELARTLLKAVANPFFRVEAAIGGGDSLAMKQLKKPDPKGALELTKRALAVYQSHDARALNLAYSDLVHQRAVCHASMGDPGEAREELQVLQGDLAQRGVNATVLDAIDRFAASFAPAARRTPPKTAARRRSARKRASRPRSR